MSSIYKDIVNNWTYNEEKEITHKCTNCEGDEYYVFNPSFD